jgi:Fic family protein
VRAILLHFWLAYDHPFVDGNGRTARALFYWSMLREGYWLCEYISISRILRKAPVRYGRAFLYTETDDNDLTYFLLFQLGVLRRAIEELGSHLKRKALEVREVQALLRSSPLLNHRQLALLTHALKHPGHPYTVQSHRASHAVVYETARSDLLDLVERDLLVRSPMGRKHVFSAPADLTERLKRVPSRRAVRAGGSGQDE